MRTIAVLTALVAMLVFVGAGQTRDSKPVRCTDAERGIVYYRAKTWEYQDALGESRRATNHAERAASCGYKKWAAGHWRLLARVHFKRVQRLNTNPQSAICAVFGNYCSQAIAVSSCETGGTFHVGAQNGQYLGLFQMGSSERRKYGHGYTALEQSRAAFAYFVDSGRDWSPWSCKPW